MLTAAAYGRLEHRREVTPGTAVALRFCGPRRCIGVWSVTEGIRVPCVNAARIDPGPDAQCGDCAARDRGRTLARDQLLDSREYTLYLAWVTPGLPKVGLTATERGRDRLLEQAALGFAPLARGPLMTVRRAEQIVAGSGLARERITHKAKVRGWWNPLTGQERAEQLTNVHTEIHETVTWPVGLTLERTCHVTDQVADFSLAADGLPKIYRRVTAIDDPAVVSGRVLAIPGRHLLLAPTEEVTPLLIDTRLVAGWTVTPAGDEETHGIEIREQRRPPEEDPHAHQDALF